MKTDAKFSDCGKYRYWLLRQWDDTKPTAVCIGLNPSTANGVDDDRTIESLIRILKHNEFGAFYMMNLFAFITPSPDELRSQPVPLGENDKYLDAMFGLYPQHIIFCWGKFAIAAYRAKVFVRKFPGALCLGKNKDGSPVHPLYKKATTKLIPYETKRTTS